MKQRRKLTVEFRRQVIEKYLSGVSTAAQLMRRHEISSGLLYHWKDKYTKGSFDNSPTHEAAMEERVRQLEQLVGRLTPGERVVKKPCSEASHPRREAAVHR